MGDFAALVALVARVGLVVTAVVLRESESSSLATAAFSFFRALLRLWLWLWIVWWFL